MEQEKTTMAKTPQGKKKFVNVGAMLQRKENDDQDRPTYWLKLDKEVEMTINGKKVTALNISRPTDKFERMLKAGKITAEEYENKIELYNEKGDYSFVKFEFTAAIDE